MSATNASKALNFCRLISHEGIVYLPGPGYLAEEFGWDAKTATEVLKTLVTSGDLAEFEPNFYRVAKQTWQPK
ncbi:hypothetical protein [Nocardia vulneris]|uniref:Uncharacterized protein n=1 Tax=Nocardia vulneris TaxID=1141657 RepID=A0ABR4Z519_9NOCA|nr:hypothetical protein [Nocardia vulneris]KIA60254.1 hypothetical protein FG87_38275 [Nocardia vulneris]